MSCIIKNKTSVSIGGREYSIVSGEDTGYIQKIAIELDERIKNLSSSYFSLSSLDVTTLAALNLMDEYVKAKEELASVSTEIEGLRTALRDMQLKLRSAELAEAKTLKKENERLKKENAELRASLNPARFHIANNK